MNEKPYEGLIAEAEAQATEDTAQTQGHNVHDGIGDVLEFAEGTGDLPPAEQTTDIEDLPVKIDEESAPSLDDVPETPLEDLGKIVDDIPESGLSSAEDLASYIAETKSIEELKQNIETRDEAIAEYRKLLQSSVEQGVLPGSPRIGKIVELMRREEKAKKAFEDRIVELSSKRWWSPKRWFKRG